MHSPKDLELSKDVCRSMVAMLDKDQSGKLDFEQFKTLLNDIAMWKVRTVFDDLMSLKDY